MNGKRSDIQILADILKVTKDGAKKSHIVYKANLNFELVKRYLKRLRDSDLIAFPSIDNPLFRTTPKGFKYIIQFENLIDYIKI